MKLQLALKKSRVAVTGIVKDNCLEYNYKKQYPFLTDLSMDYQAVYAFCR